MSDNDQRLKKDAGKADLDLVPAWPIELTARVFKFGEKKYWRWGWTEGMSWGRLISALKRHVNEWGEGKDIDVCASCEPLGGHQEDCKMCSGENILGHILCCAMMLACYQKYGKGVDDRHSWSKSYAQPL